MSCRRYSCRSLNPRSSVHSPRLTTAALRPEELCYEKCGNCQSGLKSVESKSGSSTQVHTSNSSRVVSSGPIGSVTPPRRRPRDRCVDDVLGVDGALGVDDALGVDEFRAKSAGPASSSASPARGMATTPQRDPRPRQGVSDPDLVSDPTPPPDPPPSSGRNGGGEGRVPGGDVGSGADGRYPSDLRTAASCASGEGGGGRGADGLPPSPSP